MWKQAPQRFPTNRCIRVPSQRHNSSSQDHSQRRYFSQYKVNTSSRGQSCNRCHFTTCVTTNLQFQSNQRTKARNRHHNTQKQRISPSKSQVHIRPCSQVNYQHKGTAVSSSKKFRLRVTYQWLQMQVSKKCSHLFNP